MLPDGRRGAFAEGVEQADGVGLAAELADVGLVGRVEGGYLVVGGEVAAGDLAAEDQGDDAAGHRAVPQGRGDPAAAWRNYIEPRFGNWPVASITAAEVSSWVGSLVARGLAPSTATRSLATLRSVLAFAVADGRVQHNVAAAVRNPTSGRARREGQALTLAEVASLTEARKGRYRNVVPVMALAGLNWKRSVGWRATAAPSCRGHARHASHSRPADALGLDLWQAAQLVGDISGTLSRTGHQTRAPTSGRRTEMPGESGYLGGPAQKPQWIAPEALIALEFRGVPFHDPFHGSAVDRGWLP